MARERAFAAGIEGDEAGRGDAPAAHLQERHRGRVIESARPGAGRIEEPDAAHHLVVGQVAVSEDDHVGRVARQIGSNLGPRTAGPVEDVREEEPDAAERDARGLAGVSAAEPVHVAGDRRDRSESAKLLEHVLAADVAAVEDVVHAREGLQHLGANEPVGIGDDPDAHPVSLRALQPACKKRAVELLCETSPAWVIMALERFDDVLVDHAHCEKKAAAHALSMLAAFPDVPGLPRAMARLAREEAGHLAQVLSLCEKRGLALGRDPGDPYAQGLQAHVRQPRLERLLDRLVVSALIELRSRERLQLLGANLPDPELRAFYGKLAKAEQGHGDLFLRLARRAAPEAAEERMRVLAREEASLVRALPVRPAIH